MIHWTLLVIGTLVAWAMLGGVWRRGSLALAASWMLGQLWFVLSGESVPIWLYVLVDPFVILVLLWWRASWLDWAILGIFPIEWGFYFFSEGTSQWWSLYFCTALQLFFAGPWPQFQKTLFAVSHGPLRQQGIK